MTELEQALVALGRELDFPPEPNLLPAVRARLERRRRGWSRPLALAVAVLVVAFGIAMAVPQARSAILDFFHIGAATVERVETLPRAEHRPLTTGLGPQLSRAAAEKRAGLQIELPRLAGRAPTSYYARPGLIATVLRYHGKPVLLAELDGEQVSLVKKAVTPGTNVEPGNVGDFALWLEGAEHVIRWNFDDRERVIPTRLAGNVLLWLSGNTTYRLEGDLDKRKMRELALDITR